jgi:hypothetical protein
MFWSSNESDIEFELHFLDCQPDSVIRSWNDPTVINHLYRAATTKILRFSRAYQRKESDRVTDIDQLILNDPVLFEPRQASRQLSIEVRNNNNVDRLPVNVKSDTVQQSISPMSTKASIPLAPPLPSSLDSAIKMQTQARQRADTPDQGTLWANVRVHLLIHCLAENSKTSDEHVRRCSMHSRENRMARENKNVELIHLFSNLLT